MLKPGATASRVRGCGIVKVQPGEGNERMPRAGVGSINRCSEELWDLIDPGYVPRFEGDPDQAGRRGSSAPGASGVGPRAQCICGCGSPQMKYGVEMGELN